jgi:phosphoserine aminotransferase
MSEKIYNFAAGPAVLPAPVLQTAASEMTDWHGSGMSVMEMSHRGKEFGEIFAGTKEKFKKALQIPDTHEVLFMQGGATAQFAAVPLNLMGVGGTADYAVTGISPASRQRKRRNTAR